LAHPKASGSIPVVASGYLRCIGETPLGNYRGGLDWPFITAGIHPKTWRLERNRSI